MEHNEMPTVNSAVVYWQATKEHWPNLYSGYYGITGRMDDVINVSGHRLGTAEIEDVLVRISTGFFSYLRPLGLKLGRLLSLH